MTRNVNSAWVLAVAIGVAIPVEDALAQKKPPRRSDSQLTKVLHYDFYLVDATRVADQSKQPHDGTIRNGEIVQGKRKPAVKLHGDGSIRVAGSPADMDPKGKALSVGALCQPAAPDGVLVAMGDERNGFSLYLRQAVPHFTVHSAGETTTVASDKPVAMNQWLHLMGTLDSTGQVSLVVNAWPAAAAQGKLIAATPEQPLCIGADLAAAAGKEQRRPNWAGLLEDIRLYWGVIDRDQHRDELGEWADLPGCGCRK